MISPKRRLIVNADDFGQSPGVNRGVIKAHEQGIVTSVSLMARWPAVAEAAAYGRAHPELSVGLHVDLGEWAFENGAWRALYQVVPSNTRSEVAKEVASQIAAFRGFLGRDPTHFDSHQHVHREEPLHTILVAITRELGVPLRHFSDQVRYFGGFYGQSGEGGPFPEGITVARLLDILKELPGGVTELGCHPGEGKDESAMYCSERAIEIATLCDRRVRATLVKEGIQLCSFHSLRNKEAIY